MVVLFRRHFGNHTDDVLSRCAKLLGEGKQADFDPLFDVPRADGWNCKSADSVVTVAIRLRLPSEALDCRDVVAILPNFSNCVAQTAPRGAADDTRGLAVLKEAAGVRALIGIAAARADMVPLAAVSTRKRAQAPQGLQRAALGGRSGCERNWI